MNWTTASETNNSHFELEHSLNGLDFMEIARIEGSGTTTTSINYHFVHDNPGNEIHHYRLRQYDFDGQNTVSKIVYCRLKLQSAQLKLWLSFPENIINISYLDSNKQYELCFYSPSGKLVYIKRFRGGEQFSFPLNEANLAKGVYLYSLQSDAHKVLSGKLAMNQD